MISILLEDTISFKLILEQCLTAVWNHIKLISGWIVKYNTVFQTDCRMRFKMLWVIMSFIGICMYARSNLEALVCENICSDVCLWWCRQCKKTSSISSCHIIYSCTFHVLKEAGRSADGWIVCWLVGCWVLQQHASISQGWICSHSSCCHTEMEVADQTCYLTQSQHTDTRPTSFNAHLISPSTWHGSPLSTHVYVDGMTRQAEWSWVSLSGGGMTRRAEVPSHSGGGMT